MKLRNKYEGLRTKDSELLVFRANVNSKRVKLLWIGAISDIRMWRFFQAFFVGMYVVVLRPKDDKHYRGLLIPLI